MLKNRTIGFLIIAYLFVVLFGQQEVLSKILIPGSKPQYIGNTHPSKPIDSRPYWTVRKHITTSSRVVIVVDAISSSLQYPEYICFVIVKPESFTITPQQSSYLRSRPRDPPLA